MDARKVFAGTLLAAGVVGLGAVGVYLGRRQGLFGAGSSRSFFGRGNPDDNLVTQDFKRPPVINQVKIDGRTVTHYRANDIPIGQRVKLIQDRVYGSVQDPRVRELAIKLIKGCKSRDNMCEAKAIYDAVFKHVRYIGDVAPVKFPDGSVEPIDFFQHAWRTWTMGAGDCLPKGTLLLTEGHRFVPIEELLLGQKIWGLNDWTEVKDVWFKGTLPVDVVHLNNGSSFKATGDHKVCVALCLKHPNPIGAKERPCSCPISERSIERLPVSKLEPGMVLLQPDQLPYGTEAMDPRRAYIEGLYLSDGSVGHDSSFDIAGQDGCPKEEQKREVERICAELGVRTTWQRKYINVQDKEWTQRLHKMGHRAWLKAAPSINLTEDAARELLRGIMADSGANSRGNGRTFTTTSRMLMLQVRMLQRMAGVSCGERYIVDHGGLGEHPIHRLQTRDQARSDGNAEKLLRVREIDRDVSEMPVYDISTADHYVYLPEADATVLNCDDHVALVASLWSVVGIPARLRVTAPTRTSDWGHIYPVAGFPVIAPRKWIAGDTTLFPPTRFGAEARYAKNLDYMPGLPKGRKPYVKDLPA